MRIDFTADGVALVFEQNKRALAKTEIALGISAQDFLPHIGLLGAVFNEWFSNCVVHADGRALSADDLKRVTENDPDSFKVLFEALGQQGNDQAARVPSPLNTKNGAPVDLTRSPTGSSKIGKSKPRSRVP